MQLFEKTLGDFLEYWAEKTPDKEFIVYSDRNLRFTYSEFNQRVNNLAKGLMAIGVKEGSHVGIWATNVPDWNTFLFATAKIGAVLVTVIPITNSTNWNTWSIMPTFILSAFPTVHSIPTIWK